MKYALLASLIVALASAFAQAPKRDPQTDAEKSRTPYAAVRPSSRRMQRFSIGGRNPALVAVPPLAKVSSMLVLTTVATSVVIALALWVTFHGRLPKPARWHAISAEERMRH